jgi:hypothetical protein
MIELLLGIIIIISHLPRGSKGEDFSSTVSECIWLPAHTIQDVSRILLLFDWWEGGTSLKVLLRCVKMDNGRQSVMMGGMTRKQELCVDNWDSLKIQEVSSLIHMNLSLTNIQISTLTIFALLNGYNNMENNHCDS